MAALQKEIKSPCDEKVKLLKWKVRKNSLVYKGTILALYSTITDEGQGTIAKLKAAGSGTVAQLVAEEGEIISPFGTMLHLQPQMDSSACTHPTIMKDMCADCGADLRQEFGNAGDRKQTVSASVAMVHNIPELIVSQEQALELGKEDEKRLLKERKLVLLVDLDQTLIHTTNDDIPPNLKGVKHFQLRQGKKPMWYHTRFRPFMDRFLQAVSSMYELHICTFGVRMYAHIIARLLDPDEKYFSHRILSRDECFDNLSKTANLKALFPCGDTMVCIIDDREDVWNFAPNLVHVKPYRFFQGTADINAPPGLTKSERDNIPMNHKCVTSKDKPTTGSDGDKKKDEGERSRIEEDKLDCGDNGSVDKDKSERVGETISEATAGEADKEMTGVACESEDKSSSATATPQNAEVKEQESKPAEMPNKPDDDDKSCSADDEGKDEDKEMADKADGVNEKEKEGGTRMAVQNKSAEGNSGDGVDEESGSCAKDENEVSGEVEWDDGDDYLLHLEEILRRIHTAYYEMHEQSQKGDSEQLPDLKKIIPYVRKKVLKGVNIVFSGMFPLNLPMEKSKAYIAARSLGANVQNDLVLESPSMQGKNQDATTHLVAAKPGTGKFKSALKARDVHVVSGDWLWACMERWEHVDERLFSMASMKTVGEADSSSSSKANKSGKRKKPSANPVEDEDGGKADTEDDDFVSSKRLKESDTDQVALSPENSHLSAGVLGDSDDQENSSSGPFSNTYNPLYSFSDEDIEFMDHEVDEMMAEGGGDTSDESEEERETRLKREVLRRDSSQSDDSDSDSLSGDFPRGWKMRRKSFSPNHSDHGSDRGRQSEEEVDDEETENELERYQKTVEAFSPRDSDSESASCQESIGSVDDEMAEAVEKEFLSSL